MCVKAFSVCVRLRESKTKICDDERRQNVFSLCKSIELCILICRCSVNFKIYVDGRTEKRPEEPENNEKKRAKRGERESCFAISDLLAEIHTI